MGDGADKNYPIANACEQSGQDELQLFVFEAGAYGSTFVYVWAKGADQGFEQFVEWLDDHAPGQLVDVDEDALREAADDLGLAWDPAWPDYDDDAFVEVVEAAEADLTPIGHTSLKHGQYIASHAWGFFPVDDSNEVEAVTRRSRMECWDHDFIVGDRVLYEPRASDLEPDESVDDYEGYYTVSEVAGEQITIEDDEGEIYPDPARLSHAGDERPKRRGFVIRGAR